MDNPAYQTDWASRFAELNFKYELEILKILERTDDDFMKAEVVTLNKKVNENNSGVFDFIDKTTSVTESKKTADGWEINSEKITKSERMTNS
ncbi:hypothetical protein PMSM_12940 [Paenibacillus macquariensis subsp. macquariensis]|uniref:Uncharacterized protein n=1 Tax=Paenibacillus macquariensis TaxID=948756 RepID=A0ABY1JU32_9BACL|nr:hypothetical protein [Paenibacillus macquariensis]OAB34746.1 hypothetical protein PMSM_12940 [Paenibacillus macquariensis subsp. macquariensis]SIQ78201.1 hypothetical protein SAMN05421578_10427 [Paenibacillus macquariensis]